MFGVLAEKIGIAESALRLLVGILLGYPCALFYRSIIKSSRPTRLSFLISSGLFIGYIFCQSDIIYSLLSVIGTWITCFLLRNVRKLALLLCFVGNFGFLLFSYTRESTDDYDINWTTCQSVLCLRLIGFVWDFYDATDLNYKPSTNGSLPWVGDLSIKQLPSLWDLFGYCYFFSAFLVGPQFSFKHYKQFLNNEFIEEAKSKSLETSFWKHSTSYALKCLTVGIFYLVLSQVMTMLFSSSMLLDDSFKSTSILYRVSLIFLYGKTALTKYFGVWILNEGPCALSGLSFNGFNKDKVKMDGVCNIRPIQMETSTSLGFSIDNFNINTNQWCKLYIYKRLRFLNNKNMSSLGTLLFLAIWHGFHSGYYITFFFEFLIMGVETQFYRITEGLQSNAITILLGWLYTQFHLFYPMISFDLLKFSKFGKVYNSVYWIPHIYITVLFFGLSMVKPIVQKVKTK